MSENKETPFWRNDRMPPDRTKIGEVWAVGNKDNGRLIASIRVDRQNHPSENGDLLTLDLPAVLDARRRGTLQYILPNLRSRWPELKEWDDQKLAELYEHFSMSEDHGDNDEKFPEWFKGGS